MGIPLILLNSCSRQVVILIPNRSVAKTSGPTFACNSCVPKVILLPLPFKLVQPLFVFNRFPLGNNGIRMSSAEHLRILLACDPLLCLECLIWRCSQRSLRLAIHHILPTTTYAVLLFASKGVKK